MGKAFNVRDRNRTNYRMHRFLMTYHMFLNDKLLTDSDFSRLIFVDEYIQSLKFKIYDESSKEQLINDIENFILHLVKSLILVSNSSDVEAIRIMIITN